jgi:hypothetical protein
LRKCPATTTVPHRAWRSLGKRRRRVPMH